MLAGTDNEYSKCAMKCLPRAMIFVVAGMICMGAHDIVVVVVFVVVVIVVSCISMGVYRKSDVLFFFFNPVLKFIIKLIY